MNEQLQALLEDTVDSGLYQIILSNPRDKEKAFKIKIRPVMLKDNLTFQQTMYVGTKVFHENYERSEMIARIVDFITDDFKQCEVEHKTCKAVVLVSKKGKITVNRKRIVPDSTQSAPGRTPQLAHNRVKRYILEEGTAVPFLVDLGVQTKEGKIVRARYDKFRQINRFLELIEDILPTLPKERTVHILDFGCGKSYLTFAMYYYLRQLKGYDVEITGLDLKTDVIEHCNTLAKRYGYDKLHFLQGDIAQYDGTSNVDMVVTLHACDTATDYALEKAIRWNAKVILSVPCCQHEVNRQIANDELAVLLQYGIIRERMSALITDALRASLLESEGYETNILEFIDMEHTPKNLLIRAVKKQDFPAQKEEQAREAVTALSEKLQIEPTLLRLLYPTADTK
jgi:SAM-dependent methyltransferase